MALALQTTLDVGAGASYTDNSNLAPVNEQDDLETSIFADATANHSGASVSADAGYRVERVQFDKETQQDETVTTGEGSVEWRQVPNTLTWRLTNSVREVLQDKSLTNTQDNRDGRSITTATGIYTARPGQANTLSLSGSYSDIRYDNTNTQDSERTGARAQFSRALTPVSGASLTVNYDDVTFDNSISDYEYYNASVGYSTQLSRLSYDIQIGYNEQKFQQNRSVDGTSYDIRADYSSSGSSWSLALAQNLTDTSVGNFNQSISGLNNSANTNNISSSYERTSAELIYANALLCQSCNWNIRGMYEEQRYELGGDDNDESAISTSLGYALTRYVGVSGAVEYREVVFVGTNPLVDYDVITYRVNCGIALGQKLSMAIFASYAERNSEDGTSDYEELRGGLSLSYKIK